MTLKYPDETVCLALEKDNMLFAVGSQSHISLYDVRCGKAVGFIVSSDRGAGELFSSLKSHGDYGYASKGAFHWDYPDQDQ